MAAKKLASRPTAKKPVAKKAASKARPKTKLKLVKSSAPKAKAQAKPKAKAKVTPKAKPKISAVTKTTSKAASKTPKKQSPGSFMRRILEMRKQMRGERKESSHPAQIGKKPDFRGDKHQKFSRFAGPRRRAA